VPETFRVTQRGSRTWDLRILFSRCTHRA